MPSESATDYQTRKLAPELAVLRLRELAEEISLECAVAQADRQPQPEPHPFIVRIAGAGFHLPTFMALHKYLERCRHENTIPESDGILRAFLL